MIWLVALLVLLCFAGVVLFGAPYVPTLRPQIEIALDLADLEPGQTLLELGSGDGRMLVAAAKRGFNAVGYELNPIMAAVCWLRTRRYRKQIKVIWGDFWRQNWPPTEVIFVFLLPKFMPKLNKKIMHSIDQPVKLVSFAFPVPGRQADQQKDGVYLYNYHR
jgi:SAM-dependent methyltransferase